MSSFGRAAEIAELGRKEYEIKEVQINTKNIDLRTGKSINNCKNGEEDKKSKQVLNLNIAVRPKKILSQQCSLLTIKDTNDESSIIKSSNNFPEKTVSNNHWNQQTGPELSRQTQRVLQTSVLKPAKIGRLCLY